MENTYVTKTTNTVTMNKDSARLKHNHRDVETIKRELEKDPSRSFGDISKDKVLYTKIDNKHKSYESVVNDWFKESNQKYNEQQKKNRHKERCHKTYCSGWAANGNNKSKSPVMEIIIQVGGTYDKDKDYATGQIDPSIGKRIMIDFVNQFIKRYPLLKIIDVTYHQGERTPHIHLDFVPMAKDPKFGYTASLDKACEQMGYGEPSKKDPKKTVFHIKHFEHDFHKLLDDVCLSHGIEIDHPGLERNHESVRDYKQNEKLLQENTKLETENKNLTSKNKTIEKDISEKEASLSEINVEIENKNNDLAEIESLIKEAHEESDKLAAELTEGLALQEKLDKENKSAQEQYDDFTSNIDSLNTEIEEKQEELKSMSAEQFASDIFVTISDNVKERFDQIAFYPGSARYESYSKDDFKKQTFGDGYIVSEKDLDNLLKNQYDFNALGQMIQDLFKSFRAYLKKIFEQANEKLIEREREVNRKEERIEPAYESATKLEYKYKSLVENTETEIRHEARAQAKILIEEAFEDPKKNTRGARAIAFLEKIGYLDDFEKKERILKQRLQNIDWS